LKKIVTIITLVFLLSMVSFADNTQDVSLSKYDKLYQDGNYELILKDLAPAVNQFEKGRGILVNASNIIHARNLIADSYRMLGKYTQAAKLYNGTVEGYFDGDASYYLDVIKEISIIKGRKSDLENLGYFKLLDNVSVTEKHQYFEKMITLNANRNVNLELEKHLAGDISLDNLLQNASKDDIVKYTTYAGLSLEVSGEIAKARELYTQVLTQKSNKIETLLADNRMGLLALKMIYTTESGLTGLSNVYAVKVSSAKLEDNRLYSASNLIDNDPKTAWVPVSNKSGIGEWVEFSFDDPMQVNSLLITNGYAKSTESFIRNNRIKTATLEFSDGSKSTVTLQDTSKPQTITIRKKTRTIRLIIDEVYKGTMYDDTCLSDMELEFGK